MTKSIFDRIHESREAKRKLSEQQRQKVYDQVLHGETETAEKKELYRLRAERAILKAKKAAKSNDSTAKRLAMQELKLAYGCYHYMGSVNDAFRTMHSQMQMQEATQEFASVVESLSKIRLQSSPINFADLTRKALKGFETLDISGLDSMVDSLIRGSIAATESDQAEDAFLEKLVSGEVSLDAPYHSMIVEEFDNSIKEQGSDTNPGALSENDDIMALLDQMAAGLNDN